MKKLLILISFISSSGFAQTKFELASNESLVTWKGSNVLGGGHQGTLRLVSGSLLISADRKITGGMFIVDMNSIKTVDGHNGNGIPELDDHLKSNDFFATTKFPTAFFSIAKVDIATNFEVNRFKVTGLLTIKEITNEINFPAFITVDGGTAKIKATVVFNRTKWDIIYQSANFLANIKDIAISDNIEIEIDLNLKRQVAQ